MPADLIHLVRHGEVANPEGILYGRLPGFGLSERGQSMAQLAATSLANHPVTAVYASPLQRTRESAAPWEEQFAVSAVIDERIIEPTNRFEGGKMSAIGILRTPKQWRWMVNPWLPSWGEPYTAVRDRMLAAMTEAWDAAAGGEVVMVSHQMPIWTTVRAVAGRGLAHNPARRRCSLSSITSFHREAGGDWVEVGYQEPAAVLLAGASDTGAV